MLGIESWPHHQASPIPQSDFNARIVGRARLMPRHSHFQELCWRVFLQPLLPHEKVRPAQPPLTAECRRRLPTSRLFSDQSSPLRPRLLVRLVMAQLCGATESFTRWGSFSAHHISANHSRRSTDTRAPVSLYFATGPDRDSVFTRTLEHPQTVFERFNGISIHVWVTAKCSSTTTRPLRYIGLPGHPSRSLASQLNKRRGGFRSYKTMGDLDRTTDCSRTEGKVREASPR